MTELSKATIKRIEAEAEEKEYELMAETLLESNDENVNEALQQAFAVVKLIYSEEIDEQVRVYKEQKINQAKNDIIRKKKDEQRMLAEMANIRRERDRDNDRQKMAGDWEQIVKDLQAVSDDNLWKKHRDEANWRISNTLGGDTEDLWKVFMKHRNKNDDPPF